MCDINLTYDLAVVTLRFKTLSRLYLGICKVGRLIFGMDIG